MRGIILAKELSILDSFQESSIRGNVLNLQNLKMNCERMRSQVKKQYKLRTINWDHGNHDEDEDESDQEDVLDEKIIPEATTNGGVVDAMTLETSMTRIDKKKFAHDNRDAFISPTTFYSHIVGTKPPIPEHPLDPAAWVFGPVDRFSKFYHTCVRMDTS
eukprot:CAMPEP_0116152706 /NCGR_PEP_ID=MMETSP0329-20121206/20824_1 /TAXON_ID=697910 /ORGANISM="Pseudo-nitzschia arenysensis, Strain B593" /LENGTH=159 /DNA_ID=CAMNT_0003649505 /DNA_START=60 /DNA_END=535 /DNA_ORIENTATION=-